MEDFTGRGLDDLRHGIIRTPLAPRETFLDGEIAPSALCKKRRKPEITSHYFRSAA